MEINQLKNFPKFQKFQGMNILGADFGSKVIGLATFCPGKDPFPMVYERILNTGKDQVYQKFKDVISEEVIEIIVIGLPYYQDGTLSPMAKTIKEFTENLSRHDWAKNLKIFYQDETLTSFEAQDRMKKSAEYNYQINPTKIDSLSAAIIIEDFIKSNSTCSL